MLLCSLQGYKRKSNSDSGSESTNGTLTAASQKKPRLFFSEDQKTALRQAYIADPYPNQAAIESLAADIGVGVKTVVNWFHNHRMRAKQQPLNSTDLSSTHCLVSAVKTEICIGGENAEQQSCVDDGTEPSQTADVQSPCPAGDAVNSPASTSAKLRTKNPSAASRRKRARPHRLSAGIILDRTVHRDVANDADNSHAGDAVDLRAAASEGCCAVEDLTESDSRLVEAERERNIERLQRNLEQEPTIDWEF